MTVLGSPIFAVALTVVAFAIAEVVERKAKVALANPVLVAIVLVALVLRALRIPYRTYADGAQLVSFFLGPSVVALGLVLHERLGELWDRHRAIVAAIGIGSVVGVLSAAGLAHAFGASPAVVATLAPKSTTTPIAMAVSEKIGGIPSLAAVVVVGVGILGAAIGPPILRILGVRSELAIGLALGASAHGVGTAKAAELGPRHAAASALALCLMGIATALVAGPILSALGFR